MKKKIKRKFKNYFFLGTKFKREFRRQLKTIILITLGFTIAFTWRQTIFDISQYIISLFINIRKGSTGASILTSIFITIVSLIFIVLTSKYFREDDPFA